MISPVLALPDDRIPAHPTYDARLVAHWIAVTEEPFLLTNATRWTDALREAGGDVVMAERAGSPPDFVARSGCGSGAFAWRAGRGRSAEDS
jgi:hypothetical protein